MMGWTAEIVRHPPKLVPEEVMKKWVRELTKEGVQLDREKLQEEPKGPRAFLPKRWIVERTFSWLGQNRRMSLATTRGYLRAEKPSSTWR
jgi:transposase